MSGESALRFVHPDLDDGPGGLRLDAEGGVALADPAHTVRQAILLLLSTRPGERVMRPDYGCDLDRLAFAPIDATTAGLAAHAVRQALTRWEPRIEVLAVDAEGVDGLLTLTVDYRIRAQHRRERLVYLYAIADGVG